MPNEPEDVAKVEDIHSVKQEEVSDKIEEVNATNEVGEEQVMAGEDIESLVLFS